MSRVVVCGSLNMDVVVQSARRPAAGETLLGAKVSFLPGGKGLNQAVAAARLGVPTAMMGAVGDDAFGNALRAFLADNDVDSPGVRVVDGQATGRGADPGRRGRQRDHRRLRRQRALRQRHGRAACRAATRSGWRSSRRRSPRRRPVCRRRAPPARARCSTWRPWSRTRRSLLKCGRCRRAERDRARAGHGRRICARRAVRRERSSPPANSCASTGARAVIATLGARGVVVVTAEGADRPSRA